jgi:hypothetical protein
MVAAAATAAAAGTCPITHADAKESTISRTSSRTGEPCVTILHRPFSPHSLRCESVAERVREACVKESSERSFQLGRRTKPFHPVLLVAARGIQSTTSTGHRWDGEAHHLSVITTIPMP